MGTQCAGVQVRAAPTPGWPSGSEAKSCFFLVSFRLGHSLSLLTDKDL